MAFALPLFAQFFGLVQEMGVRRARPLAAPRPACRPTGAALAPVLPDARSNRAHAPQRSWSGPTRSEPCQRPLRVLRVVDGRCGSPEAGRMVISGRMADVCAELDRLAALETRH